MLFHDTSIMYRGNESKRNPAKQSPIANIMANPIAI